MKSTSTVSLLLGVALAAGCDGSMMISAQPFRVGTVTFDPDLPAEPALPALDQLCATLEASN